MIRAMAQCALAFVAALWVACEAPGSGGPREAGTDAEADAAADAAGSDAGDGEDAGLDPEAEAQALCDKLVRSLCDREFACGTADRYASLDECVSSLTSSCRINYTRLFRLVGSVLDYDEALDPDCDVAPASCEPFLASTLACQSRFEPISDLGEPCMDEYLGAANGCAVGFCRTRGRCGSVCEQGTVTEGESCFVPGTLETVGCAPGLYCSTESDYVCRPASGEGETCDPDSDSRGTPCRQGLFCAFDKRCKPVPAEGEPCVEPDGYCPHGLYCRRGTCTSNPATRGADEPCTTWLDCDDGLRCVPVGGGERVCAEPLPVGEECVEDLECEAGTKCFEETCVEIPVIPVGEPCERALDLCVGGCCEEQAWCFEGSCQLLEKFWPVVGLGETCTGGEFRCPEYSHCDPDSGVCVRSLTPGAACTEDVECIGRCKGGTCTNDRDYCIDVLLGEQMLDGAP